MMAMMDDEIGDEVFAELEAAWVGRRDASAVDRLAAEHPELSEELYEFFADLVLGEGDASQPGAPEGAPRWDAQAWLELEGHRIGREAAEAARGGTQPPHAPVALPLPAVGAGAELPFLDFVEEVTELDGEAIALRLEPNVSIELLLATRRHPELFPRQVREELALRAERLFGISTAESLASFDYEPARHRRAASRGKAYGAAPTSFRELLRQCGLTPEQQMYWISIAKEG